MSGVGHLMEWEDLPGALRDRDGYAPIESYAAIGDGRTTALVCADGSIDWLPLPTATSPPVFAALLGPERGGSLRLAPTGEYRAARRYVEETNVLETTFTTEGGSVKVTDSLNVAATGELPWSELARVVEGIDGEVELSWEVAPGDRFHTARPWVDEARNGHVIVTLADQLLGLVATGAGEPTCARDRVRGTFTATPGSSHLLAIVATDAEPLYFPAPHRVRRRVSQTIDWWRAWRTRVAYDGPWQEAVVRSALALKLLTFGGTGAILAAPTTSLPEIVGGPKNYDYRFAWVRDMAFTVGAMFRLDVEEEVHKSMSWLLSTVRVTAPDVHVFYTVEGKVANVEDDVPVPGYRKSTPVRAGNRAESQTQLESFGALFDPVWAYVAAGHHLDNETASMLASCADRVCDTWSRPDAGLWELTDAQHYTASKVGCWTALDRAVRLAEVSELPVKSRARWVAERDAIAAWVREHCWSPTKRAYTFYAGTDDLDAAVLLSARIGFDRGERMSSTIDALREELGRGPLLYRYSAMVGTEGTFLACSFWLVEALAQTGRMKEAVELMDELVVLGNDVGLYSEEMDPEANSMLGNFPQALTHLALVNAATIVHDRLEGREGPGPHDTR